MPRRIMFCLAVSLCPALAASAPKPKGDHKPVLYLPTTVGDKRVLELSQNGKASEITEWVTAVETKGEMTVVSFTREEGGPPLYQYGASADGVFGVSYEGEVYDRPLRVLKLPPKEGETWEVEPPATPGRPAQKFKYTTGKEEEVEVPAGKFKAVRVDVEGTTHWHAPGVGMVKSVTPDKRGDRVQVLKSFTPGKLDSGPSPSRP
jgi:hypothetical protein